MSAGKYSTDNCPDCGGNLVFLGKDTHTGIEWREYECENCKRLVDIEGGVALWQALSDAREQAIREKRDAAASPGHPMSASDSQTPTGATILLAALQFAAHKHSGQRRKDSDASPYINHPIAVADVLARVGDVTDLATLTAALLHDTIEDTETSSEELEENFGEEVRLLVQELTDDKTLPKQERKRLQVEHAPLLSARAKEIKIADKICNLSDITLAQPSNWTTERKRDYLNWAERVVHGCRGCNSPLEKLFEKVLLEKRGLFDEAAGRGFAGG